MSEQNKDIDGFLSKHHVQDQTLSLPERLRHEGQFRSGELRDLLLHNSADEIERLQALADSYRVVIVEAFDLTSALVNADFHYMTSVSMQHRIENFNIKLRKALAQPTREG